MIVVNLRFFTKSLYFLCFLVKGEVPRRTRGSLIGMMNEREFGVSFLEANITDNVDEGSSTLQARLENIPPSVGESQNVLWVKYFKRRSLTKFSFA